MIRQSADLIFSNICWLIGVGLALCSPTVPMGSKSNSFDILSTSATNVLSFWRKLQLTNALGLRMFAYNSTQT